MAKSVLKSDHQAVYINCDNSCNGSTIARRQTKCYHTSASDVARLFQFFEGYNWITGMHLLMELTMVPTLSVDQAFVDFVTVLQYALEYTDELYGGIS